MGTSLAQCPFFHPRLLDHARLERIGLDVAQHGRQMVVILNDSFQQGEIVALAASSGWLGATPRAVARMRGFVG